jgi:hypothetical protein
MSVTTRPDLSSLIERYHRHRSYYRSGSYNETQQRRSCSARTDHDKRHFHCRIAATGRKIDHLVYDLYGLTEEEIAIVEREVG